MTIFKLITNADIYTPEPYGIGHILVCGETIAYIGSQKPDLGIGLDIEQIDLAGRRLLPGFIDGHTHITGGGGETGYASRVPTVPLSDFTSAGVTTAIGLLGTDDLTRSASSLIAATYALREQGMSAWCYTGGYHFPLTTLTESAIKDIVHIDCVIGVGELAISDHRGSQINHEELARIASETHVAGLMTGKAGIVHLHLGDGKKGLALVDQVLSNSDIPPRVLNPTHVNRLKTLFDDACELVARGVHIDLTAFPIGANDPGIDTTSAVISYLDKNLPLTQLSISSDGGGCLPVFNTQGELEKLDFGRCSSLSAAFSELLDANIPIETAAPLFSKNVAGLLRLKNKGELKVGNDADIISINAQHKIEDVMCRGTWHVLNQHQIKKGMFE